MSIYFFKKGFTFICMIFLILLLVNQCNSYLYLNSVKADFPWSYHTIEPSDNLSRYQEISIDTDSNSYPHICILKKVVNFTTGLSGVLVYASWNGSNWSIQNVDSTDDVGYYCDIVVDSNDNPHISYFDKTSKNLKYAYWNGSSWNIQVIDSEGDVGYDCSIDIDSKNKPHIGYYDHTEEVIYSLKYAYLDAFTNKWTIQTVEKHYGWDLSLKIDSKDKPSFSHYDFYRNQSLKYIYLSEYGWLFRVPDYNVSTDSGKSSSLAIDSNDNSHIGYIDNTNRDLKYAYWTGESWIVNTINLNTTNIGFKCSLALDSNDKAHIGYEEINGFRNITYAYWTGNSWERINVKSGRFPDLALDLKNIPHICYINNNSLQYAYPTIFISSPYTDETWIKGQTYEIKWVSNYDDEFVNVELYKEDEYVNTFINESDTGIFQWNIPEDFEDGNYKIKTISSSNNEIFASNSFNIKERDIGINILYIIFLFLVVISIIILAIILRNKNK